MSPVKPPVQDQSSAQTQALHTPGRGMGAVTHSSPPHLQLSSAQPDLGSAPALLPQAVGKARWLDLKETCTSHGAASLAVQRETCIWGLFRWRNS